jgi:hypothetical protein
LLSQLLRYGIHRQIVEFSPVQLPSHPVGTERRDSAPLDDEELPAHIANVDEATKRAKRSGIEIRLILLTAVKPFKRLNRTAGLRPWVFAAEDGDGPKIPKLLTRSIAGHLDSFAEHKVNAFTLQFEP